ncbi:hypothetical protein GCM10027346_07570 [Hymenobacter seoulensis]
MTERESEQFYHDLQRKLEGYGSAPPESVWAGIREQVPAEPKRRWRPLLLFLLIGTALTCLTIGTRPWRQQATPGSLAAGSAETTAARLSAADAARSGSRFTSPSLASNPDALAEAGSATSAENTTPAAKANPLPKAGNAISVTSPTAASRPTLPGGVAISPTRQPERDLTETSDASNALAASGSATASRTRRNKNTLLLGAAAIAPTRTSRRLGQRSVAGLSETAATSSASTTASRYVSRRLGTVRHSAASGAKTATGIGTSEATSLSDAQNPSISGGNKKAGRTRFSNAPLALLVVKPPVLETEEPEVRAKRRSRTRPTKRELRLRGWSAQALIGSGLTYRALGGTPTQLQQLERPGVGFSGQVSGAYALTKQLTVSAGLGYAEYASNLNYRLKKDSLDKTLQVEFRDVYRFLTVPLQLQYTLQGNHRWRTGVLGGATVAFLTSARTTEGNACNCSQRQWQPSSGTNIPFQATNVLLNVGAFANYQFAPGQWITLRPQGQIFLNSLTTQASGKAPRRPWSLGFQAGYSWDLDPRKH